MCHIVRSNPGTLVDPQEWTEFMNLPGRSTCLRSVCVLSHTHTSPESSSNDYKFRLKDQKGNCKTTPCHTSPSFAFFGSTSSCFHSTAPWRNATIDIYRPNRILAEEDPQLEEGTRDDRRVLSEVLISLAHTRRTLVALWRTVDEAWSWPITIEVDTSKYIHLRSTCTSVLQN